jgi:hypothetical protein
MLLSCKGERKSKKQSIFLNISFFLHTNSSIYYRDVNLFGNPERVDRVRLLIIYVLLLNRCFLVGFTIKYNK